MTKNKFNIQPIITFLFAYAILLIAFSISKLYPFGTRQIMIIDSWHQYYPILQELHYKLTHGKSLFYTWQSGAGTNFWLMMSYYAMSPLNLLSVFVDASYLREFMAYLTLFKIAIGGAFFTLYLQKIHDKKDLSTVIFGLFYAFCGFFMGYYWNIMWLDIVALLPLLTLGLHRLIFNKKIALFVLSFSYILIANFYMAYFICIYIGLYTFVLYIVENKTINIKVFAMSILRVVAYSILSFGMAMIVLLPVFYGMQLAYGLSSYNPKEIKFYYDFIDIFTQFLTFAKPTVVDGAPNLSIGLFGFILSILYFLLPKESIKSKVSYAVFLFFLFLSLNINYLNFGWHGFHFPNQVPYRFSFIISFMLLTLAYKAYLNMHTLSTRTCLKVIGIIMLYALVMEKFMDDIYFKVVVYGTLLFGFAYGLFIILNIKKRFKKGNERKWLIVLVAIELIITSSVSVGMAGNSSRTTYPAQVDVVSKALSDLHESDSSVHRVEMYPLYSANDPILYGYKGVTQFSSTTNSKFNAFTKLLGLSSDGASNSYKYLPNTPVANGLLNIHYLLSKNQGVSMPNKAYELVREYDNVTTLKNKYAFPFGFIVKNDIYNFEGYSSSPFLRQEEFMYLATNQSKKMFTTLPQINEEYKNMTLQSKDDIRYRYKNIDASQKAHATLTYKVEETNQVYVYMLDRTKKVELVVGSKRVKYDPRRGVIMDLGILQAGTEFSLSFDTKPSKSGYFDIHPVAFDEVAFKEMRANILTSPLMIDTFTDTKIKGTITVRENAPMYTSIPYDKGWKAYVDGVKVETVPLKEGVLMIPLSVGEHQIELIYTPEGFVLGAIISFISLLIFIVLLFFKQHSNKKTKQLQAKHTFLDNEEAPNTKTIPPKAIDEVTCD